MFMISKYGKPSKSTFRMCFGVKMESLFRVCFKICGHGCLQYFVEWASGSTYASDICCTNIPKNFSSKYEHNWLDITEIWLVNQNILKIPIRKVLS